MENKHMSDNEIFEMLKPKLDLTEGKGIFLSTGDEVGFHSLAYGISKTEKKNFTIEDMKKAVALVYRKGYGRGAKGRPFNYGDSIKKIETPVNTNKNEHNFKVGDRVVNVGQINNGVRNPVCFPNYGPRLGSIGVITEIDGTAIDGCNCRVMWSEDSGADSPYLFWTIANTLRKVIDKKPENDDNVVMIKKHKDEMQIGVWYPPVGYCGKIEATEGEGKYSWVCWEKDALDKNHRGDSWNILNEYLVVVE